MNLPIDEKLQGNILTPPKRDEGPMYTKKGTLRKRRPKTKNQYFREQKYSNPSLWI